MNADSAEGDLAREALDAAVRGRMGRYCAAGFAVAIAAFATGARHGGPWIFAVMVPGSLTVAPVPATRTARALAPSFSDRGVRNGRVAVGAGFLVGALGGGVAAAVFASFL